ncbi:uncharacterized protein LOC141908967 [Tubulanus polymorphus]|uniref:uncharacterized protein LOC141908967 n=1 Tax=Tubulanus polymorphus TaxID=672921 RepID=UPI003DA55EAB
MGKKKPFAKRVQDFCNKDRMARMVYLCAMTCITTGFIICVLLIAEILMPYLKIHLYERNNCTTIRSYYMGTTGWEYRSDKWPKCRPGRKQMSYPCAKIEVRHQWNNSTVFGLLHEDEYNLIDSENFPGTKNCSFSRCTISTRENAVEIHRLMNKYGRENTKFTCLVSPSDPSKIVLRNYHTKKETLIAVLVPGGLFVLGLLTTIFMICLIGCKVWGYTGYGATAQWEKSIIWNDDAPPKKGFPHNLIDYARQTRGGNQASSAPNTNSDYPV